MRKARLDGRSAGTDRHVRMHFYLLRSDAWRALSGNARGLYLEVATRYNGQNNGRISYSLRQAAQDMSIGRATAMRAINELTEHGFLVSTRKGHFDRKVKHATEWRMTEFGCDVTGALASKDFMKWTPQEF